MLGTIDCAALAGFFATKVRVEVDIIRGIPAFSLVGLAENSVKEARVRVQSAILNSDLPFPRAKISVNLAPADLQKSGCGFDVSIALAILMAEGIIPKDKLSGIAAIGELSLTAEILPVRGMLALAESIKHQGIKTLIVAKENAWEASLIKGLNVKSVNSLKELVYAILERKIDALPSSEALKDNAISAHCLDMSEVVDQEEARRALLISAAGDHNLLFIGGPGSGKSMMAHRLPTILPPLEYEESLVLTKIHSIAGLTLQNGLISHRPFRSPHHSITRAGLVGGGSKMIRPGEISLASFGVLFLDELLEFPRSVLEVLRQPMEEGQVTLSRAHTAVSYPACFSLVGALNPCPCGNLGQGKLSCICSPELINRYQSRLSGPLIDRIDLHVSVPAVNLNRMIENSSPSSSSLRERVILVRQLQRSRFKRTFTNGKMTRAHIKEFARLKPSALNFLIMCGEKLKLSARSFDRIIRVARTIADLDTSLDICEPHIGEALHYRPLQAFAPRKNNALRSF